MMAGYQTLFIYGLRASQQFEALRVKFSFRHDGIILDRNARATTGFRSLEVSRGGNLPQFPSCGYVPFTPRNHLVRHPDERSYGFALIRSAGYRPTQPHDLHYHTKRSACLALESQLTARESLRHPLRIEHGVGFGRHCCLLISWIFVGTLACSSQASFSFVRRHIYICRHRVRMKLV
jgi:hypothetical protein